jgi:hypothetical protein
VAEGEGGLRQHRLHGDCIRLFQFPKIRKVGVCVCVEL